MTGKIRSSNTSRIYVLSVAMVQIAICAPAMAQSAPAAYQKASRFDAGGRLLGTISPPPDTSVNGGFLALRNQYDSYGRLKTTETGSLSAWQSEDVLPEKWTGFSPSMTTSYEYDAFGRRKRVSVTGRDGSSTVTDTSYDTFGRVDCEAVRLDPTAWSSQTDACKPQTTAATGADRITRTSYDKLSRPLAIDRAYGTNEAQTYVSYTYTATGKKEIVTDANGNRTKFHYNGFDEVDTWYFHSKIVDQKEIFDDTEIYGYDDVGNRTSLVKRDGVRIDYTYDSLNRLTKKDVPASASGAAGYAVYYGYDLTGQQVYARFGSPDGFGVTNTYDGFGRLKNEATTAQNVSRSIGAEFDTNGNRTQLTTPFKTWSFSYDGLDRLSGLFEGSDISNSKAKMSGWAYNPEGQVENVTEQPGNGTSWKYDGLGRLTDQSDTFVGGRGNLTTSLQYNAASQLVEVSQNNQNYIFSAYYNVNRSYNVNSLNQYSTSGANQLGYDANGNLTRVNAPTGDPTYIYDSENRLVRAGAVRLSYDPLGRLFQVSSDQSGQTQFLYDGDQLVAEFNDAGGVTQAYVHGPGVDDPLLWYPGSDSPQWLHRNHQGSIIATASAQSGGVDRINNYDPYGIPGTGNTGRFQYTGQAWLPELGLYYYKARLYSPTLGRFLQTDPIGYDDQINLYAYVANDPVNGRDPDGTDTVYNFPNLKIIYVPIANMSDVSDQEILRNMRIDGVDSSRTKIEVRPYLAKEIDSVSVRTDRSLRDTNPDGARRSHTDSIGGREISLSPGAGSKTQKHEFGHTLGAGDQYGGGVNARGQRLQRDVSGSQGSLMGRGTGVTPNQQTINEISRNASSSPRNTQFTCTGSGSHIDCSSR